MDNMNFDNKLENKLIVKIQLLIWMLKKNFYTYWEARSQVSGNMWILCDAC